MEKEEQPDATRKGNNGTIHRLINHAGILPQPILPSMPSKRKRNSAGEARVIHPRNKYADKAPDFKLLASLYPNFEPYVFFSRDGRPKIDWTDFNATRELTRVLLLHDHGIEWWIPDGQLCPTVPNRSNYIHWIEDLLASDVIPGSWADDAVVKGFDIGTGANCIYPLLGASLLGWKFVGSDITDVAIEWANKNVKSNPHISELIEIRRVDEQQSGKKNNSEGDVGSITDEVLEIGPAPLSVLKSSSGAKESYNGPPVLFGVVKEGENFDFCMCNPPFFESMDESGLNPNTSCGGSQEEMVCNGGERAFITRIIEDSVKLKQNFRWFTSMVGRKLNLNILVSELWNVGVTVVKTTEFVQGKTSRWGLAWSFLPTLKKVMPSNVAEKKDLSFMLEGIQRQYSAFHVLQSVESFLASSGATCKLDTGAFRIDITASKDQCNTILKTDTRNKNEAEDCTNCDQIQLDAALRFRILVFQQIPGTLLVRGTLHEKGNSDSGLFPLVFQHVEEFLRNKFCKGRALVDASCSRNKR